MKAGRYRWLYVWLMCLMSVAQVYGKQDSLSSDYILIINSYTASTPWSRNLIEQVTKELLNKEFAGRVMAEHMNSLAIDSEQALSEFSAVLDQKYTQMPRVIIYLGNDSWALLHARLEYKWANIPCVLFSEEEYIGPAESYFRKEAVPLPERISLFDRAENNPNLTVVLLPVYIQETVELMTRMMPRMEELVFISDRRWVSAQYRSNLSRLIQQSYPKLKLRFLTEGEMKLDSMFLAVRQLDGRSGILFSSWIQKSVELGNVILNANIYKIISKYAARPIFTLKDIGVEDAGLIGGYMTPKEEVFATVRSITSSFWAKTLPTDSFYIRPKGSKPIVNYDILSHWDAVPSDALPNDVLYYNKSESVFVQYKYVIAGVILVIIILLLIIYILLKTRYVQRKEIALVTDYMNLFNHMPIAYMEQRLVRDRDGNPVDFVIEKINPRFEQHFSSKEKLVGQSGRQLMEQMEMDVNHFYPMAFLYNKEITTQYYHKKSRRHYTVIITPSEKSDYVDLFLFDNSELVQTQEVLRRVNHKLIMSLDVANITPWKWDLTSQMIFCDMNRLLEYTETTMNQEGGVSITVDDYFKNVHKQDRERVWQAYQDLVQGHVEKVHEEFRMMIRQDRRTRFHWIEVQATVDSRDQDGAPLVLIGSSLIITQRKALEGELISAKEKAEESNRLKSAFLANMSHEIRTPLNAIVGFSGILAQTEEESEKQEYVHIIENNNTLLLQLVGDILDLSKIEAGSLEFVYTNVDVCQLLADMVQSAQLRISSQEVRIELTECVEECYIRTERNRLMQVLTNLLTNAIKFTSQGSIQVGCRLTKNDMLYFWVQDTGCGIPKDRLEDIFVRFVKLNSFVQGTGLGLPICKTIIEYMGGTIGVNSEQEKGSTFWFTLPYTPVHKKENIQKPLIQTEVEKTKLTVLIAEDNQDNFKLFESILSKEYRIIHAWNGEEAVELFKTFQPHLILMDINMPVMDGYEATARIRKLSDSIPIIAVTAYAYASDQERILESGFDAYTPKPVNALMLRKQILDLLKTRLIFI